MSRTTHDDHLASRRPTAVAAVVLALVMLAAGCGEKKNPAAGPPAAKVNKDEIAASQISFLLQQQRGLRPEQTEAAGKQVLERLIDQQLALQKAEELKLDRDPRVQQQLDIARRELIARAYAERVGEAAAKPTADEIKKYYDDKPALFRERRIYSIQEIAVEARPEQQAELRDALGTAKNINEFVEFLKSRDYRFTGNQAVRAAEQLPLNSLESFARMKDGQAALVPAPNGVQVVVLAGSRSQPISEEQARPAIEQFIVNERKRKLVEDDVKALRAAAKIEYFAPYAAPAASSAAVSAVSPASAPAVGASEAGKGSGK